MQDFRNLKVWEKAHELTLAVYKATAGFPAAELYGLTSQIRRSSASIPANVAEGCGRSSDAEFAHFLQIAMGSTSELEYQLLLSRDLGLVPPATYLELDDTAQEVQRMIAGLIKTLRVSHHTAHLKARAGS